MKKATQDVITIQAITYPSLTSAEYYAAFLYYIMWPKARRVVEDSIKTSIYVIVTVELTGVFYRTVGINAIKDTIRAAMLTIVLPVRRLS